MASRLPPELRYIDIGANLNSPSFSGLYHSHTTPSHPPDHSSILARARKHHIHHLLITGSDIPESRASLELARQYNTLHESSEGRIGPRCWSTVGVHPCSALTLSSDPGSDGAETSNGTADATPAQHKLKELRELILQGARDGTVRAIGECGLDYDRLTHCSAEIQRSVFEAQLDMAVSLHSNNPFNTSTTTTSPIADEERLLRPLPLFLHSRAAHTDFTALLRPRLPHLPARGVVHSFTGSMSEMQELVELGLDIGVNGCSLKTEENLEVVRQIPLGRLQLETDAPWCEVRASSAGMRVLESVGTFRDGNGEERKYRSKSEVLDTFPKNVKKEKWSEEAMVKGRNEPCMIGLVAEIVARVKGVSVDVVTEAAWRNSCAMFGFEEDAGRSEGGNGVDGVDRAVNGGGG